MQNFRLAFHRVRAKSAPRDKTLQLTALVVGIALSLWPWHQRRRRMKMPAGGSL
jgi:hypothetical protein